jgi:hypothetical protein
MAHGFTTVVEITNTLAHDAGEVDGGETKVFSARGTTGGIGGAASNMNEQNKTMNANILFMLKCPRAFNCYRACGVCNVTSRLQD